MKLPAFLRQPRADESWIIWLGTLVGGLLCLTVGVVGAWQGHWVSLVGFGLAAMGFYVLYVSRTRSTGTAGEDEEDEDGPVRLTDAAAAQLRQAKAGQDAGCRVYIAIGKGVGFNPTGTLDFNYTLEFRDGCGEAGHVLYRSQGLPIAVVRGDIADLAGTELDHTAAPDGRVGFLFRNPNAPARVADRVKEQLDAATGT